MNDNETSDELNHFVTKAMDSPGYLLFGAFLTPRKDAEQRPIIDFHYRRHHFALEDCREAIKQLKKFVDEEYRKIIEDYGEGEHAESD